MATVAAEEDPAGATPLAVMACVVTGPNTGSGGCAGAGCAGAGGCVVVVTTVVPAATDPVDDAGAADAAFSFSTCPGWIV